MWHKAIEDDLTQIFGIKKVLFGSPGLGKEQDVLFCEEDRAINSIKNGKAIARVYGKVSIIGLLDKNKSGYLSKRIQLAPVALTNRFVFGSVEQPVVMGIYEERFTVYSLEFLYFYKEQYNPPTGKITVDKLTFRVVEVIKRFFKRSFSCLIFF